MCTFDNEGNKTECEGCALDRELGELDDLKAAAAGHAPMTCEQQASLAEVLPGLVEHPGSCPITPARQAALERARKLVSGGVPVTQGETTRNSGDLLRGALGLKSDGAPSASLQARIAAEAKAKAITDLLDRGEGHRIIVTNMETGEKSSLAGTYRNLAGRLRVAGPDDIAERQAKAFRMLDPEERQRDARIKAFQMEQERERTEEEARVKAEAVAEERRNAEHLSLMLQEKAGRRAIESGEVEPVQFGPNGRIIKGERRKAREAEEAQRERHLIEHDRAERAKEAAMAHDAAQARRASSRVNVGMHRWNGAKD
ncbi:MAG: hypothetical protein QOJ13_2807 [Gaiellales bacterium]|nr:hypothetical protein [Gaiellales bacterium]